MGDLPHITFVIEEVSLPSTRDDRMVCWAGSEKSIVILKLKSAHLHMALHVSQVVSNSVEGNDEAPLLSMLPALRQPALRKITLKPLI